MMVVSKDIEILIYAYKDGFERCDYLLDWQWHQLWLWKHETREIIDDINMIQRVLNRFRPQNYDGLTFAEYYGTSQQRLFKIIKTIRRCHIYVTTHIVNGYRLLDEHKCTVPFTLYKRIGDIASKIKALYMEFMMHV